MTHVVCISEGEPGLEDRRTGDDDEEGGVDDECDDQVAVDAKACAL